MSDEGERPPPRRRKKVLDLRIPFFRPVWRRIALVAALIVWTGVELAYGNVFWAVLVGCIGVYAAREFYIGFDDAGGIKNDPPEQS